MTAASSRGSATSPAIQWSCPCASPPSPPGSLWVLSVRLPNEMARFRLPLCALHFRSPVAYIREERCEVAGHDFGQVVRCLSSPVPSSYWHRGNVHVCLQALPAYVSRWPSLLSGSSPTVRTWRSGLRYRGGWHWDSRSPASGAGCVFTRKDAVRCARAICASVRCFRARPGLDLARGWGPLRAQPSVFVPRMRSAGWSRKREDMRVRGRWAHWIAVGRGRGRPSLGGNAVVDHREPAPGRRLGRIREIVAEADEELDRESDGNV